MNGSDEQEHETRDVHALRSQFEALAAAGSHHGAHHHGSFSLHVPRKLSVSHVPLPFPHRGHNAEKAATNGHEAEAVLADPELLGASHDQKSSLLGTSLQEKSPSAPPVLPPRATADSSVATSRPVSPGDRASNGEKPPIPARPARPHALTVSAKSNDHVPIPPPRRGLSSPMVSSPRSQSPVLHQIVNDEEGTSDTRSNASGRTRPNSPLEIDEAVSQRMPPSIPPRPALESSDKPSSSPRPPPLPSRQSTSPSKPAVPPRVDALAVLSPISRRSSDSDASPHEPTGTLLMRKASSDVQSILPPPQRVPHMHGARHGPLGSFEPAGSGYKSDSDGDEEEPTTPEKRAIDDLPDATYASRLPPEIHPPRIIHSKSNISSACAHGTQVVTCGLHHVRAYCANTGVQQFSIALPGEPKTTFIEFRGPKLSDRDRPDDGRHLWIGCKDGQLFGIDTQKGEVVNSRANAHNAPIVGIYRRHADMLTLDESGKLQVWVAKQRGNESHLGETTPKTYKIERVSFSALIGDKLWTATHFSRVGGGVATATRAPLVRVYAPFASDDSRFSLLAKPAEPPESGAIGAVTASAILQSSTNVFLGHETGHISIWNSETYECIEALRISSTGITAMCGAGPLLWTGYRSGAIYVYDVQPRPWKVVKSWKAHKDAVTTLFVDASCLWLTASLHVVSIGLDQIVHFWDGFLRSDWLAMHLLKREAEFCTYDSLRVLMCTWNLDAAKPQDLAADVCGADLLPRILHQVEAPDVIVFGFQEMIDLEDKRLTAKSILFGRKRADALLSDNVSTQYRLWHDKLVHAVRLAMPADCPYSVTHTENLVGLFTCIFVKNSARLRLRDMDISTVKTGMGGRYGNKGAIVSRFVVDDSSIAFVNCHLAAGQSHLRQRNKDLIEILEAKAPFADVHPACGRDAWVSGGDGAMVFDHSIVFLSGDLNYRVDMRRETVIKTILEGSKLDGLLAHDQLLKEMRTNAAFRLKSFAEAPITFAPTYKYDRGSDVYDTSEKARAPAWCDRILWRVLDAAAVQPLHYKRHEVRVSDHRPVSAAYNVRVRRIDHDKKQKVEGQIATRWSEHEHTLIEKAKIFHYDSR